MKKEQKRKNRNEVGIIKKIKQVDKDLNKNEKYHNINAKGVFKRLNSIRSKLIFAFLVPVIFIIVLGVVSYTKSSKGLTQSYESSSLSTLSYMTKYLDFCLGTVSQDVDNISDNEVLVNYYSGVYKKDPNEETKRFQEMKSTISSQIYSLTYINNMYVFSNYGKGFSGNNMDTSKLNMDNFTAKGEGALPKKNGVDGMWVGKHPYLDELSGTDASGYALSYIRNVYDIFENPISCIVVNISYKYIMSTIAESGLPEGGAIAFISSDNRAIVSGTLPKGYSFTDQAYLKKIAADKKVKIGSKYIKVDGKDYLLAYSKLDKGGCMLCTVIPKKIIVNKAEAVKQITLIIVIMACVIAIALGSYIAYGFSKTIHDVNNVLYKTEAGDLTCYTHVKRKDEFHILGKSINDVISSMQKLIQKMTGTSNTVTNSANVVSESSTILVSATQNISYAVNDIQNGVSQQAADAENCLHQMSDLSEKINKLYSSTHNIEQIAGTTERVVGDGMGIVNNLSTKVKDTTEVTRTVISDIENLDEESKAISGIIETINQIAEQTNLLSLNASIEAARAGEYGRGFSVVAEEIRKLADQSLQSSNEIAEIIKRIKTQTNKTVNTAKHAEEIVLSQNEALTGTVNAFMDINKHVESLAEHLNQIADSVEGIEKAKNDTLRSIESISATSQETAAATEELSVIAENQLQEVNKLNDVVQQLNDDAGSLAESVSVFKIN